jgi:hypothetical protein
LGFLVHNFSYPAYSPLTSGAVPRSSTSPLENNPEWGYPGSDTTEKTATKAKETGNAL